LPANFPYFQANTFPASRDLNSQLAAGRQASGWACWWGHRIAGDDMWHLIRRRTHRDMLFDLLSGCHRAQCPVPFIVILCSGRTVPSGM